MKDIFFTSDLHLGHSKIIEYCKRPFVGVREMNETLIANWNKKINKDNDVYILGDFVFGGKNFVRNIISSLNGRKHLIKGNHDKSVIKCSDLFVWIKDMYELNIQDIDAPMKLQKICMLHYPMLTWNKSHYGSWALHGHVHNRFDELNKTCKRLDVGVDTEHANYSPLSYEEIKIIMNNKLIVKKQY